MEVRDFIAWYEQAFNFTDMDADTLLRQAAYLDGLSDGSKKNKELKNIANRIRKAANVIAQLKLKALEK